MLLLAAVIGPMIWEFTRFTDIIFGDENLPKYYPAEKVITALQIGLQIVLYFFAKDVNFSNQQNAANYVDGRRYFQRFFSNKTAFMDVLIIMAFSNLNLWANDSFVLPFANDINTSGVGNTHWKVLDNVMKPVSIFFLFNSAMFFWSAYKHVEKTAGVGGTQRTAVDARLRTVSQSQREASNDF